MAVVACHSGVTHATTRTQPGSWAIGKKVPANRNIGMIPNRNSRLNPPSFS